jgi:DNA-binding NarL/FixJ family response regulator
MNGCEPEECINVHVVTEFPLLWLAIKVALESKDNDRRFAVSRHGKSWFNSFLRNCNYSLVRKSVVIHAFSGCSENNGFTEKENTQISPISIALLTATTKGSLECKFLLESTIEPEELSEVVWDVATGNMTNTTEFDSDNVTRADDLVAEQNLFLLTAREREVLELLSEGFTNEAIALELFITLHTVKSHIRSILRKLKVSSRTQAALLAAHSTNRVAFVNS